MSTAPPAGVDDTVRLVNKTTKKSIKSGLSLLKVVISVVCIKINRLEEKDKLL